MVFLKLRRIAGPSHTDHSSPLRGARSDCKLLSGKALWEVSGWMTAPGDSGMSRFLSFATSCTLAMLYPFTSPRATGTTNSGLKLCASIRFLSLQVDLFQLSVTVTEGIGFGEKIRTKIMMMGENAVIKPINLYF